MSRYRITFLVCHDVEAPTENEALAGAIARHPESHFLAFESCELITDETRTSFALPGGGHATFTGGTPDKKTLEAMSAMMELAKKVTKNP